MTFTQPFSDYEILARVGSGAMGTVFKARQKKLDRIVAIKVLKPALARDARYVDRLMREARIVGALNHPNIVAGFDLGEEGGYHYFVMEFIDGRSLKDLLREWGSFPEAQVLDVAIQVAHALDHAWQKGVIHRDVKPGNILIDTKGRVKLTDMGLAKGPEDQTLTSEGATVGTPQYISPEQARDPQTVDIRSDLYSLGATLFHMETGQAPFTAETTGQMIVKLLHERAPSASALNPAVSDGLSLVTRKLLAKDPALRYQTPAELLSDLGRVKRQEPPAVDVRSLEAESPRRHVRVVVGAAAVLLAGVLGVSAWISASRADGPAVDPQAQLAARLEEQLRDAKSRLAGWQTLRRAEEAERDPSLKRVVQFMREGVEHSWCGEVDALLTEQMRAAPAYLMEPEHWREPARFFAAVVEPALRQRFGVGHDELPLVVKQRYEGRKLQYGTELNKLEATRDAEHLARFEAHVEEDAREALDRFVAGRAADFRGAEAALREAIDGWHGRDDRPSRHELPDPLRRQIERREGEVLEAGARRIEQEERRAADGVKKELDEREPKLRSLLEQDHPALVAKALRSLEQDLQQSHPESAAFRSAADPWPEVQRRLRLLQSDVQTALAQAEGQRLGSGLVSGYVALLSGGEAKKEGDWLKLLELSDQVLRERRDKHVGLLEDAQLALTKVFEALAAGRQNPIVASQKIVGGVRLDRRNERFVALRVVPGAGAPQLLAHELPWAEPEWLAAAGRVLEAAPADARRGLARGLAVWLEAARAGAKGLELVADPQDRTFLANALPDLVRSALEYLAREDRPDAREALAALRTVYAERDLEKVRVSLSEFDDRYGASAAAASCRQELRDIRAWLKREQRRVELRGDLQKALPPGSMLDFDDDGVVHIALSAEVLQRLCGPDSFELAGNELVAKPPGPAEPGFVLRRLPLPPELPGCELRSAVVTLRFPEPAATPRVAIVTCAGVALVVQVLRANALASALVPVLVLDKSDGALRQALQKPLEAALLDPKVHVVPGARHELVLRTKPPQQRGMPVSARAVFEGSVLREETSVARGVVVERAEIRCVPGVALCHVELLGTW